MSKTHQLVKNTLIIAVGRIFTQFTAFILLPLYTYFLDPAEYGFADLTLTYVTLLAPVFTLQVEMAAFRFLIDARNDTASTRKVISNVVYMAIPLILYTASAIYIIGKFINLAHIDAIVIAGVAITVGGLALQVARGVGDNKRFAIASILIGILTLVTAVLFIGVLGMRVDGVLLSLAVSNLTGVIYLFVALHLRHYIKRGEDDKVLRREMFGYSIPLIPNSVAWWIINVSDRTIIALMLSVAANGIYAVSSKYAAIFAGFQGIFNMSWMESASMHINAGDRDAFFSSVSNAVLRIFGALGLVLIAVIPFVFPWLVDAAFHEAYAYIPLLIIAAFLSTIVGLYSAVYVAKKLTRQVMNTSLAAAVINIVLTITFLPIFGLYAAAGATAAAFLIMVIFRHFDTKKYVVITYEKRIFAVLVITYAIVGGCYYSDTLVAVGLVVAIITAVVLNRRTIPMLKDVIFKRRFQGFQG